MATHQELLAALEKAKKNLRDFEFLRYNKNLSELTEKFGEPVSVYTEDSEGMCDNFKVFGGKVKQFYFVGRESLETLLAEEGFDELYILHENGEVYHFISEKHIAPRKRKRSAIL